MRPPEIAEGVVSHTLTILFHLSLQVWAGGEVSKKQTCEVLHLLLLQSTYRFLLSNKPSEFKSPFRMITQIITFLCPSLYFSYNWIKSPLNDYLSWVEFLSHRDNILNILKQHNNNQLWKLILKFEKVKRRQPKHSISVKHRSTDKMRLDKLYKGSFFNTIMKVFCLMSKGFLVN